MLTAILQGQAQQLVNIDPDTGIAQVRMPGNKVSMQVDGQVTSDNINAQAQQLAGIQSGIYTPTATALSGTPSNFTVNQHQWMQVGKILTISGSISILTADTDPFEVALALPVPTANFASAVQAAGTALEAGMSAQGAMLAQVGGQHVVLAGTAADATQQTWVYQFMVHVS